MSLFSGFGLGTILMPFMALFFPVTLAIAITAIVHMANNLFKVVLFGKYADKEVIMRFAIVGTLAAFAGAFLLTWISAADYIATYELGDRLIKVTPVKITIGLVMIGFAIFELVPSLENMKFDRKWLPIGGLLSGFFGGLSGNQGAMRAAFLSKSGLSKEAFIGTGVVIAFLVDIVRLLVYSQYFAAAKLWGDWGIVVAAALSAFTGSYLGAKVVKKVTIKTIHTIVGITLIGVGLALISGIA